MDFATLDEVVSVRYLCNVDDGVCNLYCEVGDIFPEMKDCEVDENDCFFNEICLDLNCRADDVCNEKCGEGILLACGGDIDCTAASVAREVVSAVIVATIVLSCCLVCTAGGIILIPFIYSSAQAKAGARDDSKEPKHYISPIKEVKEY